MVLILPLLRNLSLPRTRAVMRIQRFFRRFAAIRAAAEIRRAVRVNWLLRTLWRYAIAYEGCSKSFFQDRQPRRSSSSFPVLKSPTGTVPLVSGIKLWNFQPSRYSASRRKILELLRTSQDLFPIMKTGLLRACMRNSIYCWNTRQDPTPRPNTQCSWGYTTKVTAAMPLSVNIKIKTPNRNPNSSVATLNPCILTLTKACMSL